MSLKEFMDQKIKHNIQIDTQLIPGSATAFGAFNETLNILIENGYEIISLPQSVQLMIKNQRNFPIVSYSMRGENWTREGIIHFPNGELKLVRNSPILYSAEEATRAHRENEEFFPNKKQIEFAVSDSVDLPKRSLLGIPSRRIDSEEITVYAFGGEDKARNYGEFLKEKGIETIDIWGAASEWPQRDQPYARQMFFTYAPWYVSLGGYSRALHHELNVQGVSVGAEKGIMSNFDYVRIRKDS